MRVKLPLVICHDDGHEETVTDVVTLNKNNKRIEHLGLSLTESKHLLSTIQRHLDTTFSVPGLRDPAPSQGPQQPLVSHLVRHL
jgi:hypothetical protein